MPQQSYLDHFRNLQDMPTPLGAGELARLDPMLRAHSFFSAKVEDIALLRGLRELCERGMREGWNEGTFRRMAREWMREATAPDGEPYNGEEARKEWSEEERQHYERDVRHVDSLARLKLIFRTQMAIASEYTAWQHGMSEQQRYDYPAWEFYRQPGAITKRRDHVEHEGDIVLKTDYDYWIARNNPDFGGFGVPWPPFGYNSWMHIAPVDRDTCESLGLIHRGDKVEPLPCSSDGKPMWGLPEKDLSAQLSTRSIKTLTDAEREELAAWCRQQGVEVTLPDAKGKVKITPQLSAPPSGQASGTPTPTATPAPVQPRPNGLAPGKPATIDEAIQGAGLDLNADATEAQMQKFLNSLHDRYPANREKMRKEVVREVTSAVIDEELSKQEIARIRKGLEDVAAMCHPSALERLPKITVRHVAPGRSNGYDSLQLRIRYSGELSTRTISHEFFHALHLHGTPALQNELRSYFQRRTLGEKYAQLNNSQAHGKSDHWAPSFEGGSDYAGCIYNRFTRVTDKHGYETTIADTKEDPLGAEMPTVHLEKITLDNAYFLRYWNDRQQNKYLWRECFMKCLKLIFQA